MLRLYGWFAREYEKMKDTFGFQWSGLEILITEKLVERSKKLKLSKKALAKATGVDKDKIDNLFAGFIDDLTIKDLVKISRSLKYKLVIELKEKS